MLGGRVARFVRPMFGKAAAVWSMPFLLILGLVMWAGGGFDSLAPKDEAATAGTPGMVCGPSIAGGVTEVAGFSGEQLDNAAVIVAVGKQLNVAERGWVIAVATAIQESTLMNINYGDTMANGNMSSSRGLFQQLITYGDDRTDPARAAEMFYNGGPNGQKGLLQIPGWESMPLTQAAQAVQLSGLPDAYAKWEDEANLIVGSVVGRECTTTPPNAGQPGAAVPGAVTPEGTANAKIVMERALAYLGTTYAWGGGNASGPTRGIRDGGTADAHGDYNKVGFDCSGLALYAYAGIGVSVPHQTKLIYDAFPHLTREQVLPGDLLLVSDGSGTRAGIHHVVIYLGNDSVVEAPQSGEVVKITDNWWSTRNGGHFIAAVRPGS